MKSLLLAALLAIVQEQGFAGLFAGPGVFSVVDRHQPESPITFDLSQFSVVDTPEGVRFQGVIEGLINLQGDSHSTGGLQLRVERPLSPMVDITLRTNLSLTVQLSANVTHGSVSVQAQAGQTDPFNPLFNCTGASPVSSSDNPLSGPYHGISYEQPCTNMYADTFVGFLELTFLAIGGGSIRFELGDDVVAEARPGGHTRTTHPYNGAPGDGMPPIPQ